ncbi:uncharacterized protein LOC115554679 isoform X1 [Gadus morhua]|uniref:uncharacterized protein LOC115554679 isoform X1 n=1 Tax=Gadus morhua TaxID=8049 RepID=UPI0011B61D55|nr:uncharacterized protein LOC115554679 isoform X1 [Gadus morhua]
MGRMCVEGRRNEGRLGEGSGRDLMRVGGLVVVLSLIVSSSGASPNSPGISLPPVNVSVATGKRAEFSCGMANSLNKMLKFTMYAPKKNLSITCVGDQTEATEVNFDRYFGECKGEPNNLLAVLSIVDAKLSDNGIYVRCQSLEESSAAFLNVEEPSNSFGIIIGCTIGAFITTLLVFGALFHVIRGSEKLQQCFRGPVEVEEDITMATVE